MTEPLPEFQLAHPRDIQAALEVRGNYSGSRFLAGGTDVVVSIRRGLDEPTLLIDLSGIGELTKLKASVNGINIGAGVTLATLAATPAIRQSYRAVSEAAEAIAGPAHRTVATVGGNLCLDTRCIYYNQSKWWRQANGFCLKRAGDVCHVAPQGQRCHATFNGDLAPALMALGAEVEIAGVDGRRRIALADLYAEDGRAHLRFAEDELIVAVHLPADPPPSSYAKLRVRGAMDFPLAGVSVALGTRNGEVVSLRIGLTGTNSRPFLLTGLDSLIGRPIDADALQHVDRLVQRQVQPMRTTLASAHYRRLAAAGLARRLVATLYNEANQST